MRFSKLVVTKPKLKGRVSTGLMFTRWPDLWPVCCLLKTKLKKMIAVNNMNNREFSHRSIKKTRRKQVGPEWQFVTVVRCATVMTKSFHGCIKGVV